MLLSKLFSSRSAWSKQDPESTKIRLPTEIWIHIWSFLDFNTLQKISILVSKEWFCKIRNSARLSGEMILRLENRNAKDINNVLFQWPKLKVLHLSDCQCGSRLGKLVSLWEKLKENNVTIEMLGINLTENALLEKIIVPRSVPVSELGGWGKATKVWIDPKNLLAPPDLENIFSLNLKIDKHKKVPENIEIEKIELFNVLTNVESLSISGNCFNLGLISSFKKLKYLNLTIDEIPRDFEMAKIGQTLPNVEELFVECENGENFNLELILGFKSLKTLKVEVYDMDTNAFLDTLRSLKNVKAMNLFAFISMDGTSGIDFFTCTDSP